MLCIAVDARMVCFSGIGVVLQNLLRRIIALRPAWHFRLLGAPDELVQFQAANVEITPFCAPVYSVGEQRLGMMLASLKPDLTWSPHYNIPLLWRGPLLVTVHDLLHMAHPDLFPGPLKQGYARLMFEQVRRQAGQIVFVSQFTANEFQRLIGTPRRPGMVIHSGVDAAFYRPQRPRPHANPYLLFVGNIKAHKNLQRLVEAFETIADRVPHDLVLVGRKDGFINGGKGLPDIAGMRRVMFTGPVSDGHLAAHYAHADGLAMPSVYEGFGLPPLEAMASGCPVLAARAGALPEICGDAALYCDPGRTADVAEKLLALLTNGDLRARLRSEGRERVALFDWDRSAAAYVGAMENLL